MPDHLLASLYSLYGRRRNNITHARLINFIHNDGVVPRSVVMTLIVMLSLPLRAGHPIMVTVSPTSTTSRARPLLSRSTWIHTLNIPGLPCCRHSLTTSSTISIWGLENSSLVRTPVRDILRYRYRILQRSGVPATNRKAVPTEPLSRLKIFVMHCSSNKHLLRNLRILYVVR